MKIGICLVSSFIVGALLICLAAAPASATVLCHSSESKTSCSEPYEAGTEITSTLSSGTKAKLKTSFKTVECSKSAISATTENTGGETETVRAPVATLTFEECNCTVTVLKKGTLELHGISETTNGTITENGAEVTISCSTILGTVHCIYVTENTDLGTLTGGNPAGIDLTKPVARLTTSGVCSSEATLEATYEVTSPNPLYVIQGAASTNTVLCNIDPKEVSKDLECPKGNGYSGVVTGTATEASTFTVKANPKEVITCTKASFEGNFNKDGTSAGKAGGITKFAFESAGNVCTSTLPGTPAPSVKVEGNNLPFERSYFPISDQNPSRARLRLIKTLSNRNY